MSRKRIFFALTILVLVFGYGLSYFIQTKIIQNLDAVFAKMEGASYASSEVKLLQGEIGVFEIKLDTHLGAIAPDFNTQKSIGTIKKAHVKGLSWWDLWQGKKLSAKEIAFLEPNLKFIHTTRDSTAVIGSLEKKEERISVVEIENIRIEKGSFSIYENTAVQEAKTKVEFLSIELEDFVFDESLSEEKMKVGTYKINLENFAQQTEDRLHELKIGKITTQDDKIDIHDFSYKSPLKTDAFMQKLTYRKSKFDLHIPQLTLHQLSLTKLFQEELDLPLVQVKDARLAIFADKNIPEKPNRIKKLPTAALAELDFLTNIDSIIIKNAEVIYSLKQEDRNNRGEIYWQKVNAQFENITNDSLKVETNPNMLALVNSKFMGSSDFTLAVNFSLDSPVNAYDFHGELDTFDMKKTNQIFEDVTRIRVKNGNVQSLIFDVRADENQANGSLDFHYRDLHLELINKKGKRKRRLLKWLIEKVIIKEDNLLSEKFKKGEIETIRNKEKGIFNQMWNAVLDGLKDVILPS